MWWINPSPFFKKRTCGCMDTMYKLPLHWVSNWCKQSTMTSGTVLWGSTCSSTGGTPSSSSTADWVGWQVRVSVQETVSKDTYIVKLYKNSQVLKTAKHKQNSDFCTGGDYSLSELRPCFLYFSYVLAQNGEGVTSLPVHLPWIHLLECIYAAVVVAV